MTDFDSFVDLDWLGADNENPLASSSQNDGAIDLESMSSADLFKYFLESEIGKDFNSSTQAEYPSFTQESNSELPMLPSLFTPNALMSTIPLAQQQAQLTSFSLPNSPALSHHADEDVTMSEIKSEPVMIDDMSLLRVLAASSQLDNKTSAAAAAAVAALTGQQTQQEAAKPAQQAAPAKTTSRNQRASSIDSDDEPLPTDTADLKKMTSKERRQLRNKISARNFRVRRKEYISTLEAQVQQHQDEAKQLREQMLKMEEENKKLREEVELLRQQPSAQTLPPSPPSASADNTLIVKQARVNSPVIAKPNLNKDISISGTRATDTYRPDHARILVSNAIMPEWNFGRILAQDSTATSKAVAQTHPTRSKSITRANTDSTLADLTFAMDHPREAALATAFVTCLMQQMVTCFTDSITAMPVEDAVRWLYPTASAAPVPTPVVENEWDMPLKPDELNFSPKPTESVAPVRAENLQSLVSEPEDRVASAAYMEWLYDAVIMAALSSASSTTTGVAHEPETQVSSLDRLASFFWWDGTSSV